MSQVVGRPQSSTGPLQTLFSCIVPELGEVEDVLRREMRSRYPFVDEMVRYGCLLGGKRLRPALLLLAAKATGQVTSDHMLLGAVVEMIHTATLVHDDVLDQALVRRHLATVNTRWDDEASVLLGDFLFTHAFYLASTLDSTLACQWIGRATNVVCEGEIRQKGSRGQFSLGESEYLEILNAKTAELCACCCRLGARYAGADQATTERLERFGRYLGIAFQIADDLMDVAGDEASAGKSLGTDLQKQKPTLPVIRALQQVDPNEREEIEAMLAEPDRHTLDRMRPIFERTGALDYTRQLARRFTEKARDQLADLAPSSSLQTLQALTEFVVDRHH